jgi:hypothetical protein
MFARSGIPASQLAEIVVWSVWQKIGFAAVLSFNNKNKAKGAAVAQR